MEELKAFILLSISIGLLYSSIQKKHKKGKKKLK